MNDMDIRCLLAVAASKSFTAAAEELFLTQQAVSKYISNIEKELGVKLFVREYGRVTATEAGERYIELFNELKDGLNKLSHETAGYYDKLVQNFRIGYSLWIDPFGEIHRGIDGFSRKNPETAFTGQQYHNDLLIAGLNSGELDVAIISGAQIPLESEFAAEAIAKEDICLFVHDSTHPPQNDGIHIDCDISQLSKKLPFLVVAAKTGNNMEFTHLTGKEILELGITPKSIKVLPTLQSLYAELLVNDCMTLNDSIFGFVKNIRGLKKYPLGIDSELFCIWKRINENPLIPSFVEHLKGVYL